MANLKLVSVGETTADFYPQIDQTLVGGISLNFAVQAKRCGLETVSMVSCVGDDANGRMVLDKLAAEQVDTSHITVQPGKTAHCEIVVLDGGERYFPPGSYRQHVLASYKPSPADCAFIQTHDILVTRFDIAYTRATVDLVVRHLPFSGKRVVDFGDWFDYNGRHPEIVPYLDKIDLAFISGDETTVEAFGQIAKESRTQFVITLGRAGSCALVDGKIVRQSAVMVPNIVDTTGAGDAFQAAFTVAYFQGQGIEASLAAGAENAAKTIQHFGAI